MSKKNEVQVVDVPGAEQKIDTSIDMKLSKQDLIDVVVEETRDRLENEVADARDLFEEEKKEVEKAHLALNKLYSAAIEKKHLKAFKVLKANGGAYGLPDIADKYGWNNGGLVATEYGVLDAKTLRNEQVRTSRGHYGHKTTTENGEIVTMNFPLPIKYSIANKANACDADDNGCSVAVRLSLKLTKEESIKLFTPFAKLVTHLGETKAALDVLEDQFKNVDKMGKKAKTQLVKRILESSEGGQTLLSNIGAIKANVGQLLIEATKK